MSIFFPLKSLYLNDVSVIIIYRLQISEVPLRSCESSHAMSRNLVVSLTVAKKSRPYLHRVLEWLRVWCRAFTFRYHFHRHAKKKFMLTLPMTWSFNIIWRETALQFIFKAFKSVQNASYSSAVVSVVTRPFRAPIF